MLRLRFRNGHDQHQKSAYRAGPRCTQNDTRQNMQLAHNVEHASVLAIQQLTMACQARFICTRVDIECQNSSLHNPTDLP